MSAHDFQLWLSLYAATAVCCAFALVLSVLRVGMQLARERIWATTLGWKAWVLLGPRVWWRWQKTYLLSTPVTLGIVTLFAFSLPWGQG
jgi:hypothetical protein